MIAFPALSLVAALAVLFECTPVLRGAVGNVVYFFLYMAVLVAWISVADGIVMEAVNDLENIGDTIETNLVGLGIERIKANISISEPTRKVLTDFHRVVRRALRAAIQAVSQNNREAADLVIAMQAEIQDLANSAAVHQATRLVAREPNRIPTYTIEIDIIEKQKRIYSSSLHIARSLLPPDEQIALEAETETA